MTRIDFTIDGDVLKKDLAFSPETAEPAAVEETFFIMPVRMCIGSQELFCRSSAPNPWLSLPLLGTATHLQAALAGFPAKNEESMFLAGGGQLKFSLDGKKLIVHCTLTNRESIDFLDEVVGESARFLNEVQSFLTSRVPNIEAHEAWNSWFPRANPRNRTD